MNPKKTIQSIVAAAGMVLAAATASAGSMEAYIAVPVSIEQTDADHLNTTAIGAGVRATTADEDDRIGIGVSLAAYYPLAISWTRSTSPTTNSISDIYSVPLGLDALVSMDINLLHLRLLSFPLSLGFHTKADFYKAGPQINLGIAGTAGVRLHLDDIGIFARAQVSYDFYGTKNTGGQWQGVRISQWGVQPQIGVTFYGD